MRAAIKEALTSPIDRRSLLAGVVLPAAGYLGLRTVWGGRGRTSEPTALTRVRARDEGENIELVAVLVSSSTCVGNNHPGFLEAAARLPWLIQERAHEADLYHHLVGVAIDPIAADGWHYLAEIGDFHEVVVGGGWGNHAALRYVWEESYLPAQVPQVLVLRRHTFYTQVGVTIGDTAVLAHLDTPTAVVDWVEEGAPLDGLEADGVV